MEEYRLADLSPDALAAIRRLERELGVTLVAYQPPAGHGQDGPRRSAP